jgi:hypothetical protein
MAALAACVTVSQARAAGKETDHRLRLDRLAVVRRHVTELLLLRMDQSQGIALSTADPSEIRQAIVGLLHAVDAAQDDELAACKRLAQIDPLSLGGITPAAIEAVRAELDEATAQARRR